MTSNVLQKTSYALGAGLILLAVVVVASHRSTRALVDASERMGETQTTISMLRQTLRHVVDIDTGVRGFVLTGRQGSLGPYHAARESLGADLKSLAALLARDPQQARIMTRLDGLVHERLELADRTVRARESDGEEEARGLILTDHGNDLNDEIRLVFGDLESRQRATLAGDRRVLDRIATATLWIVTLGGLVSFGLLSGAALVVGRHLRERDRANLRLSRALGELERRNREVERLGTLLDLLQSCARVEEAYPLVAQAMPLLFPAGSGALYVVDATHHFVETAATWGTRAPAGGPPFTPEECWALRRGRLYSQPAGAAGPSCGHLTSPAPGGYLCAPMMAQAEAIGVLHLLFETAPAEPEAEAWHREDERRTRLAANVAEPIALALASLRLRDSLRNQSIRDPLTGLYNRRYMEEALERELARAVRRRRPFGVLMLDLDRFKRINDQHGHEAGDAVMRAVAAFLSQRVRAGDVACRYGGEEFVVVLPESTLAESRRRADDLRLGVRGLVVPHAGRQLEGVTLSAGVAAYPDHGDRAGILLAAADAALYEAKAAGRDRVAVAATPHRLDEPESPEPLQITAGE